MLRFPLSPNRIRIQIMDETARRTSYALGTLRRDGSSLSAVITPEGSHQSLKETVTVHIQPELIEPAPLDSHEEYAYGLGIGAMAIVPARFWA